MKKLLIAIFAVLLVNGCEPETQHLIKSEDNTTLRVRKFTFEEHQYIEFCRDNHYTGFVHDPNCWCMIDYN